MPPISGGVVKRVTIFFACLVFVAGAFVLGGDLDPPAGPIAPTFKTLDEVPTSVAVNSANTPGDDGAVYVITEPGRYDLTEDLAGEAGKGGIRIEAQDFVLDLNGHAVLGADGAFTGISWSVDDEFDRPETFARRGVVRNGTVRGWSFGVSMRGKGIVEDMLIEQNTNGGVFLLGGIIRRSDVWFNDGCGIRTASGAEVVEDCLIVGGNVGIEVESQITVRGTIIIECVQAGIRSNAPMRIFDSQFFGMPVGLDLRVQDALVRGCTFYGPMVRVNERSVIEDCTFWSGNDGIVIAGDDVVIRGNRFMAFNATRAIGREGDPARCVVTNNTLQTRGMGAIITDLDPTTNLVGPTITPANIATVSSPLANAVISAPGDFRGTGAVRPEFFDGPARRSSSR